MKKIWSLIFNRPCRDCGQTKDSLKAYSVGMCFRCCAKSERMGGGYRCYVCGGRYSGG